MIPIYTQKLGLVWVLTIFNEGAYITFKSIFQSFSLAINFWHPFMIEFGTCIHTPPNSAAFTVIVIIRCDFACLSIMILIQMQRKKNLEEKSQKCERKQKNAEL